MNKTQKNIVLVGFCEEEIRSIEVPKIGNIYYLNTMAEAKLHQGFLIIINNKDDLDLVSFDKKYRKTINKYAYVWLYHEKYKESFNSWTNIRFKNRDLFLYGDLNYWDDYENYKYLMEHPKEKRLSKKRLEKIKILYDYIKNYKTLKTSVIAKDLNMSDRMIERYMHDINDIYHNVGYDYSNNEWYFIW